MEHVVSILGAGTMGAGIAQVAALAGWRVRLTDSQPSVLDRAFASIAEQARRGVEKGRLTPEQSERLTSGIERASGPIDHAASELVIEAIIEDMDAKVAALESLLPALRPGTILATNTSSLSITDLASRLGRAAPRVVGMHFFNPAPVLKLVEIIAGEATDPSVTARAAEIAAAWGKTVVRAADVPGFIVNHVARPFYLEAFRMLEECAADVLTIDQTMRTLGSFRMGPLELTDLIGQDINTATTRTVWERLGKPALLAPSRLQESLVRKGHLGRKTGRGVYAYDADPPVPDIPVVMRPLPEDPVLRDAVDDLASALIGAAGSPRERYVFVRIAAAVAAQAQLAVRRGVANESDIDTALKLAASYPHGPFEWIRRAGTARFDALRAALDEHVEPRRFVLR